MYQRAMNLRDATWHSIDFEPIEREYTNQYLRAYVRARQTDAVLFKQQTREYRCLLRAFKTARLKPSADLLKAGRELLAWLRGFYPDEPLFSGDPAKENVHVTALRVAIERLEG